MYDERFSIMNKSLQNDISISLKVQMVQGKMNLYFSLPVNSLISTQDIKNKNISNSTANNGQPTVNYRRSLTFNSPCLLCNDQCDQWLFQETLSYYFQKPPQADVLQIKCYQKFGKIHRKISVLESLFDEFESLKSFSL